MGKLQITFRLDKLTYYSIKELAKKQNIDLSEFIRNRLQITNCQNGGREKAIQVIKELEGPFAFVKSPVGLNFAKQERANREIVIRELKRCFGL